MPTRTLDVRGNEKGDRRRPSLDANPAHKDKARVEPSGQRKQGRGAGGRGAKQSHQSRGRQQ
jgi:hypothetical protein